MKGKAQRIAWSGFFVALGVLLPILIHMVGSQAVGNLLLPMHLPVFLAGMMLGPGAGAIVGGLTPVLSSFLTGMPPLTPPIALLMFFELLAYGLISGWLYLKLKQNVFVSLVLSMIAGRLVFGLALLLAGPLFGFNPPFWGFMQGAVLTGMPGVVVQLILIPLLLTKLPLEKYNLDGAKYFR